MFNFFLFFSLTCMQFISLSFFFQSRIINIKVQYRYKFCSFFFFLYIHTIFCILFYLTIFTFQLWFYCSRCTIKMLDGTSFQYFFFKLFSLWDHVRYMIFFFFSGTQGKSSKNTWYFHIIIMTVEYKSLYQIS